jgi:hypothetical protein
VLNHLSVDKVNIPVLEEGQLKCECPISNVVVVVHLIPLNGKSLLCIGTNKYNIMIVTMTCIVLIDTLANMGSTVFSECVQKPPVYFILKPIH